MRNWAAGVAGIVAVVVGAGLAACSEGYPESPNAATSSAADVCESADDLRASLTALGDVQVAQEGTDAVQEAWTTVQDDWAQLAKVAGDEYADQVDRVEADGGAVQSALETTQADPSAEALREVAAAVRVFLQDAGALADEVKSTC
jgi:hypothetical protein